MISLALPHTAIRSVNSPMNDACKGGCIQEKHFLAFEFLPLINSRPLFHHTLSRIQNDEPEE